MGHAQRRMGRNRQVTERCIADSTARSPISAPIRGWHRRGRSRPARRARPASSATAWAHPREARRSELGVRLGDRAAVVLRWIYVPSRWFCGGSSSEQPQTRVNRASRSPVFPGSFPLIRSCSPILRQSGRTVRVGFLMRFSGCLLRICYDHAATKPGIAAGETVCMPSRTSVLTHPISPSIEIVSRRHRRSWVPPGSQRDRKIAAVGAGRM
jgi:hypothetical protein